VLKRGAKNGKKVLLCIITELVNMKYNETLWQLEKYCVLTLNKVTSTNGLTVFLSC
jgi:hypothetical protein